MQGLPIITGYIVIQITPLNKLSKEQAADVARALGNNLLFKTVNVTTKTLTAMLDILKRAEDREFGIIAISPEFATSKDF